MPRFFIHVLNGAAMGLLLIGLPAALRLEVGPWELRSATQGHELIFWGACGAGVLNLILARWAIRRRKEKRLCRQWSAAYGVIALLEAMILWEWIHFDWLRDGLKALS